ncbi:MAG: GNAT family N-acetyltransferase [Oscillospiraceae bacterium]|jgi:ribosomal-protein-alanine N-acetyltransferase|nr:GNAT family N-acetyltransferase [Oscillospiraceae bacterium]
MFNHRLWLFSRLPDLHTPRLLLRKVNAGDAQDLFDYGRDPEVARHVLWDAYRTEADARMYVRYLQRQYRADQPSSWGIVYKPEDRMIGTVGFMWWNHDHNAAEIGYSLSRAYWNQGIMTEALPPVLRFGFEQMDLHRIEAQHECDNPASGRVMEKAGMTCEGRLAGRLYNKGRYVDVYLYAILRDQWHAALRPCGRP